MITQVSSPDPGNASMMTLSLSTTTITLHEGDDRIHPGLYFREDRVVRAGRDAESVSGEIHGVNPVVRVVAPECRGVPVKIRVMDGGPGVSSRKRGACYTSARLMIIRLTVASL